MRANGSIKNLTAGVGTVDPSMTPIDFRVTQMNFQNDAIQGLHRRPPPSPIVARTRPTTRRAPRPTGTSVAKNHQIIALDCGWIPGSLGFCD